MTKPRTQRTPIKVREQTLNPRTGRREIWDAVSADGIWTYVRLELPGTPWEVTHVPTGRSYWIGSLPQARAKTASGQALAYLDHTQPVA